jgi:hypothetical protein
MALRRKEESAKNFGGKAKKSDFFLSLLKVSMIQSGLQAEQKCIAPSDGAYVKSQQKISNSSTKGPSL